VEGAGGREIPLPEAPLFGTLGEGPLDKAPIALPVFGIFDAALAAPPAVFPTTPDNARATMTGYMSPPWFSAPPALTEPRPIRETMSSIFLATLASPTTSSVQGSSVAALPVPPGMLLKADSMNLRKAVLNTIIRQAEP
jgi:hypothetical protein